MYFKSQKDIVKDLHGISTSPAGRAMKMRIDSKKRACATGKRKTAVAKVIFDPARSAGITVNGMLLHQYFSERRYIELIKRVQKNVEGGLFIVDVYGGGRRGQCDAVCHGMMCTIYTLSGTGVITRDARKKERKKVGHVSARAKQQFSKR